MVKPPLGSISGDDWADQYLEHTRELDRPYGWVCDLAEWFQMALDTGQHYGAKMAQRAEEVAYDYD